MPTDKTLRSFYDELRVVERTPVIEQKSIYGLSALRDIWVGDVTSDGKEFKLSSPGGVFTSRLDTAERGPYPPGQQVEPGAAFRLPSKPTGTQKARVGYYDDEDGFFVEYNSEGLSYVIRKDSVDDAALYGTWDITGRYIRPNGSDFNIKTAFEPGIGYVYQNSFTWYGFGPCEYSFQINETDDKWMRPIGLVRPKSSPSVNQPHFPVRCEVITESGDDPFDAFVSGRQVSIVGKYDPIYRPTSIEREGISVNDTAWLPIIAARRSAVKPYALSNILDMELLSSTDLRIAVVLNPTIANPGNWGPIADVPASETLLEANLDPGPGVASLSTDSPDWLRKFRIDAGRIGGSDTGGETPVVRTPFIEDRPYVIYARAVSGTGTMSITLNIREDY